MNHLQILLDRETQERNRERDLYLKQIEHLTEALAKAQEGHNRATLLLEHHSKRGGNWEQAFHDLKSQIANEQRQSRSDIQELKDATK